MPCSEYNFLQDVLQDFVEKEKIVKNRLLVDLMVIDAEFGKENYGLIPHNYDQEEAGTT
jgi:hypothetical protein